jgi:putative ABC transport system permease protein
VLHDLALALRMLRKNLGFTGVAVLTLALGIGANTTIFSVVRTVLLKPLPYPNAERLRSIFQADSRDKSKVLSLSFPKFSQLAEQSHAWENVAAYYSLVVSLDTPREPEAVNAARVSLDFFRVLGVSPSRGRSFLPEEEQSGGANVAIISDAFWHSHFAGEERVFGKTLVLDGNATTIVGILPADFHFPFEFPEPQVWLPRVFEHSLLKPQQVQLGAGYLSGIARLRAGVTVQQAQAELDTINDRYRQQFGSFADASNRVLSAESLEESLVGGLRSSLLVLLAAVGFVHLMACANVANLLLARATAREKEIALRKALGASRARLIRQLLSESALLSLLGGVFGVSLALALIPALRSINPGTMPRIAEARIDTTVLLFSLILCLLTAVLFGLAPAMQAASQDLHGSLKEGIRGSSAGGSRGKFRGALVVAEMAVALVLMTGAGLLVESFARLMHVNLGFSPHGVMTFPLRLPATRYSQPQQQIQFYRQLLDGVRVAPGVESAGLVSFLPLSGAYRLSYFCAEGQVCQGLGKDPLIAFWQVSAGYLATMRTPLISGRVFNEHDIAGAAPVVIVNESAANHFWPNQNPLGKHMTGSRDLIEREVVGVVGNAKISALNAASADQLYVPLEQMPYSTMTLVVRSAGPSEPLVVAIRGKIAEVDATLPVSGILGMDSVIASSVAQPRIITQCVSAFAGFALLLAAIGMYGVMAYSVTQRKQEMGIRMSLGAGPGEILQLVVRQGMTLAAAGVIIGVLASLALTRLLASLLFDVSATDPSIFAGAAAVLGLSALLACYFPARRATRVDPILVLRSE